MKVKLEFPTADGAKQVVVEAPTIFLLDIQEAAIPLCDSYIFIPIGSDETIEYSQASDASVRLRRVSKDYNPALRYYPVINPLLIPPHEHETEDCIDNLQHHGYEVRRQ